MRRVYCSTPTRTAVTQAKLERLPPLDDRVNLDPRLDAAPQKGAIPASLTS